jgi:hypothetical protein
MDKSGYPKLFYYYEILNNLIELLNKIQQLNIKIIFIKVPAHNDIKFNEIADIEAKKAAQLAITQSNDINFWNPQKSPAIVDIQKWISYINC